jgi:hypothetical protein
MIQKARPSKKTKKLTTRRMNSVMTSLPPTPGYLNCSDQMITFSRQDHPIKFPQSGHSPLVINTQIGG